ncbi:4'-phosphopantetheinyl transferase [Prauserella shujinwangii]|uniref:4'-phosphopantetheinyl transferase n=1 Tax=Prauserella shujinwangii TaxID=1453103 RepID=A0A2T0M0W0_9PSEU|nr:4'-phosphopantetheinyl transferase superfamily protein [Prauserella shujinwangii]PRX50180.1 4'-phosphopantetheinyl transferase [Prauserella shujinwangii]
MIDCAVWWATPVPPAGEFLALLDDVERQRYGAYRREADQRRFLTGRVLAKTLAGERLGLDPGAVRFDATCADCGKHHGPPRLPGMPLALSISHSGDRVGIALTGGAPVGLDVEAVTRKADDGLIEYALSDAERSAVASLTATERGAAFFTYWSRKEAILKATGRGLRLPLRGITVSGHAEPARLVAAEAGEPSPARTRLADLAPGADYRAAVAVLTSQEITVTERWWS